MNQTVFALVDDMLFAAKIRAVAESSSVAIKFHRRLEGLIQAAIDQPPALFIVNLHHETIDPFSAAREIKSQDALRSIPILGFYSHVRADLQRQATAAGYDYVLPRSVFSRDLPTILKGQFAKGSSNSPEPAQ
jgi:CheY-like chemotaxis protein